MLMLWVASSLVVQVLLLGVVSTRPQPETIYGRDSNFMVGMWLDRFFDVQVRLFLYLPAFRALVQTARICSTSTFVVASRCDEKPSRALSGHGERRLRPRPGPRGQRARAYKTPSAQQTNSETISWGLKERGR